MHGVSLFLSDRPALSELLFTKYGKLKLLQNQRLPVSWRPIVPHQRRLVQCLDSIHQTIMGTPYHDDDSVVGADDCQDQWG